MIQNNLSNKIIISIDKFLNWVEEFGFKSYDQFDFWSSSIGVKSRLLFERNKIWGAPLVLILQSIESFLPQTRVFFAKKRRFAIGDAHFALSFLNLFDYFKDEKYLNIAKKLMEELISSSIKTNSGMGWGYPYDWVTPWGVFKKDTPFITVTPYCFYAFFKMFEITKNEKYLNVVDSITKFIANDLNETIITENEVACSYGPPDNSLVINASAYRAALLMKAYELFENKNYMEMARKNISFVLNNQNEDGSWFYSVTELKKSFIDNFHTCLVLKNLYISYLICKEDRILNSIRRGYDYYRNYLFRKDNSPIHFSKLRYPKFRKIEMYDYAEGISLGCMLKDQIEGAFSFASTLTADLIDKYQVKKGYFVTRVSTLETKNKIPYLRWPQAQLFYALTNMLLALK